MLAGVRLHYNVEEQLFIASCYDEELAPLRVPAAYTFV